MTPLLLLRQALRQRNLRIRAMLRFGRVKRAKYDPDQPRDDHGRWTDGDADGSSVQDDLLQIIDADDADADYSREEAAGERWAKLLTEKESRAVRAYRDQGKFQSINDYMRGGSGNSQAREHAHNLMSAMQKGDVPDGVTVWRGMAVTGSVESDAVVAALRTGAFTDNGFISASPSSAIAGGFAESEHGVSVLFKLTTSGAKGAYISRKGKEPEYLLQHGSKVAVSNVRAYKSGLVLVEGKVGHAD